MRWYGSMGRQAQGDPFAFETLPAGPKVAPPTPYDELPEWARKPGRPLGDPEKEAEKFRAGDPMTRIISYLHRMDQGQLAGLADNLGKMDHYTFLDVVAEGASPKPMPEAPPEEMPSQMAPESGEKAPAQPSGAPLTTRERVQEGRPREMQEYLRRQPVR